MRAVESVLRGMALLQGGTDRPTWLGALDARAKILAVMAFIVTVVSFDRYAVAALLPLALFPLGLAVAGQIAIGGVVRQVLRALPFALMVGLFNPWFDAQSVAMGGGLQLSAGWWSFASILIRFVLSVSSALLLVASTGVAPMCHGLRGLGVPMALTQQLLFLQRYALVLADEAARMQLARELRGGALRSLPLTQWASTLGHLLLRALQRAQRIHHALLSRGFNGTLPLASCSTWHRTDSLFLLGCSGFFVIVRTIDLPQLLGAALVRAVA